MGKDREVRVDWRKLYGNLKSTVRDKNKRFNIEMQISWQAKHFIEPRVMTGTAFCEPQCTDFVEILEMRINL